MLLLNKQPSQSNMGKCALNIKDNLWVMNYVAGWQGEGNLRFKKIRSIEKKGREK